MIWRCDLYPQYKKYQSEIDSAIKSVLNSGCYTLADELKLFEKEFADYIGCRHAVGVANGTDALILSLKASGIGTGDEVITTPFTSIPTVSAIIAAGATPVFIDVDPDTYLIDLNFVSGAVTKKTKAIMPVHLFGNSVDIMALREMVGDEIFIIEDACQAHGTEINGLKVGALGDIGAFSFYPTKNLGGYGDGGMVVTDSDKLAERIRLLRMYGMTDYNHIVINGINSRLDELQAAILRVKLRYLNDMNQARNSIAGVYIQQLPPKLLKHQHINNNVFSNYHQFVCRTKCNRAKLMDYLDEKEIQTNIYYLLPLHMQKANRYLGYAKGDFPIAEQLCNEVIALTMYPELDEEKQSYVIKCIQEFAV